MQLPRMPGMDSGHDPRKGSNGNGAQQTTKVPRQVKVKDSRQIQTQHDGQAPTDKRNTSFREVAKAVGKGNREILDSEYTLCP